MLRLFLWTSTTLLAVSAAPTNSTSCLDKCFENRDSILAANDLRNYPNILRNSENFCKDFEDLSNCSQDCPEQAVEFEEKSALARKICQRQDLAQIKECVSKVDGEAVEACLESCGINGNVTKAIRFDSNPASPINPQVEMNSIGSNCRQHICLIQCSNRKMQENCQAEAKLFQELVQFQISSGLVKLSEEAKKKYFEALPEECKFVSNEESLEKIFTSETSTTPTPVNLEKNEPVQSPDLPTGQEVKTSVSANSGEFTTSAAIDGIEKKDDNEEKLASREDETSAPRLIISDTTGDEEGMNESEEEIKELEKERKPDEPFVLASRDAKPEEEMKDEQPPHVFQPEDDFVPFGTPANLTEETETPITENPAVAMAEEDVKLVNQSPASKTEMKIQLNGETGSEEVTPKMEVINSEENVEQPAPAANTDQATQAEEKEIAEGMEKMEEAIKKENISDENEKDEEKEETTPEAILIVDAGQMEKEPKKEENPLNDLITQSPEMVSSTSALTLGSITLLIAFFMTP